MKSSAKKTSLAQFRKLAKEIKSSTLDETNAVHIQRSIKDYRAHVSSLNNCVMTRDENIEFLQIKKNMRKKIAQLEKDLSDFSCSPEKEVISSASASSASSYGTIQASSTDSIAEFKDGDDGLLKSIDSQPSARPVGIRFSTSERISLEQMLRCESDDSITDQDFRGFGEIHERLPAAPSNSPVERQSAISAYFYLQWLQDWRVQLFFATLILAGGTGLAVSALGFGALAIPALAVTAAGFSGLTLSCFGMFSTSKQMPQQSKDHEITCQLEYSI